MDVAQNITIAKRNEVEHLTKMLQMVNYTRLYHLLCSLALGLALIVQRAIFIISCIRLLIAH